MKRMGRTFVLALVLVVCGIVAGGNIAMRQMSELTGEDYAQVLAMELDGAHSEVQVLGRRYDFDGSWLENGVDWLKLAIQSGIDKVKYMQTRLGAEDDIHLSIDAV